MTDDNDLASEASSLQPLSHVSNSLHVYLRNSWRRRHFALAMPVDRFRSRNQNTILGNIWNVLNPLLTAGVYYLIFGVVLNASRGVDNYIFWLVIGLFVFRLTQSTVMQGAVSITSKQGLVRSLRFPRVLLPVSRRRADARRVRTGLSTGADGISVPQQRLVHGLLARRAESGRGGAGALRRRVGHEV